MRAPVPAVSVVIPTHDRLPSLRQCLDALASQSFAASAFEVIVVADGCTDGTADAVASARYPFALRVCTQPARGAAAARNRGAREAAGTVLLFIDDDVVASPGLVEAHLRVHADRAGCVSIGPYRLAPPADGDFFGSILHTFWDRTFAAMGGESCPQDALYVLSGNLSIAAADFHRVGGFDDAFAACGGEDYEFGVRVLAAGVPLVFVPEAAAIHLDTTDASRSLRRARQEGAAHVQLARLHPEVRPPLRLSQVGPVSRALVFDVPRLGRVLAALASRALDAAQQLHLRRAYAFIYGGLRRYWYCRGVRDDAGGRALLATLRQRPSVPMRARGPR